MTKKDSRRGSYRTAIGKGAKYSTLTYVFVMSLNALPETLTNCFMSREIPDEKHASSFRTYSLNVSPRQRPIFLYLGVRIAGKCQGVSATTSQRVSVHPFYRYSFDSGVFEGFRSHLES
jgi:hypothetical protein